MMIRLIAFLWTGCWHKWEILATGNVYERGNTDMPYATRIHLQCQRCGDVKGRQI